MAQKMTYDTGKRLFILNNGVTDFDVVIDLYSDAKEDWKSDPLLNKFIFPLVAIGGQPIGGGQVISPYIILRNGWKIRPHEADHTLTVAGNLITDDESSPFVNVLGGYQVIIKSIVSSNSLTTSEASTDPSLRYLVESLRGRHSSIGNVWYWNPASGNDAFDGKTPANAVETFAKAQTLATAGNNDVIFALSTASGGITTVNETISIIKSTLKVRGPGYTFQFIPLSPGSSTVDISADSVEFSGFFVGTSGGGTDDGINVTGDNAIIKDVWVNGATGNGISVSGSSRAVIDTCAIEDCAGNGISIGETTSIAKVHQCIISGNTGDGVDLADGFTDITDNILENNLIFNNTGWGIDVGSGVVRTGIRLHHTIAKNVGGTIDKTGSVDTFEDTSGTITGGDIDAIAEQTADKVWDELISSHTGTGSAGKTLKDAKVKATLASLK